MRGPIAWFLLTAAALVPALAQDPFEIHVYEYETLRRGQFTLEQHLNYIGVGSKMPAGPLAPANNQLHLTHELTAGIHERFSLGFMLLSARLPSHRLEYAGWRLLPHFYAPDSWRLPLKLGLVSEFSFQRTRYEENSRRVEIRPILEKSMGHVQVDFNPVFERALHGPGTSHGWNFEPAIRVGYEASKRFTPSLEYYSSAGPFPGFLPLEEQIHLFFPGADLRFGERVVWSLGVGIGATSAGNRIVYKSRLEVQFGR
jgi:hypothetical protein